MPIGSLNQAGNGNQNPLAARDLSGNRNTESTNFTGNVSLKWRLPFVKGLTLKLNGSFVRTSSMVKAAITPYELYCWNQSNRTAVVQTGRIASRATVQQWYVAENELQFSRRLNTPTSSGNTLFLVCSCTSIPIRKVTACLPVRTIFPLLTLWIYHTEQRSLRV